MTDVGLLRDDPETAPGTAFFEARLAAISPAAPVPSPCVNICRIDDARGVCLGCRRTLQEIAAWSRMDDAGKLVVWKQLPRREP